MASIILPALLADMAALNQELFIDSTTISQALQSLVRQSPCLKPYIFNAKASIQPYLSIYLNEKDIKSLENGLNTHLQKNDCITIVTAMAGG